MDHSYGMQLLSKNGTLRNAPDFWQEAAKEVERQRRRVHPYWIELEELPLGHVGHLGQRRGGCLGRLVVMR